MSYAQLVTHVYNTETVPSFLLQHTGSCVTNVLNPKTPM